MYQYLIAYNRAGKDLKTKLEARSIIDALGAFMDKVLVFDEVTAIVRQGKDVEYPEHIVRVSTGEDGKLVQTTVHPVAGKGPGEWPVCDCWPSDAS